MRGGSLLGRLLFRGLLLGELLLRNSLTRGPLTRRQPLKRSNPRMLKPRRCLLKQPMRRSPTPGVTSPTRRRPRKWPSSSPPLTSSLHLTASKGTPWTSLAGITACLPADPRNQSGRDTCQLFRGPQGKACLRHLSAVQGTQGTSLARLPGSPSIPPQAVLHELKSPSQEVLHEQSSVKPVEETMAESVETVEETPENMAVQQPS